MTNVIMCMGKFSKKAYYMKRFGASIHSVEELCYVLRKNAFLLEDSDIDDKLTDFIEYNLGLLELANLVREEKKDKKDLETIVISILKYVNLYDEKEIIKVREKLVESAGLGRFDKKFNRAVFMTDKGRFTKARQIYEELLLEIPQDAIDLKAKAIHNIGVIYAKLFDFKNAAKYFQTEYELTLNKNAIRDYLCAIRISMNEKDYIDFVAENKDAHDISLDIEKEIKDALSLYKKSSEKELLDAIDLCKNDEDKTAYKNSIKELETDMKKDYRYLYS